MDEPDAANIDELGQMQIDELGQMQIDESSQMTSRARCRFNLTCQMQ